MPKHTAGEDYLKAILIIGEKQGNVRSVDVAHKLNVSKPSVSHAVALLKDCGKITVDREQNLHLTKSGREIAENVYAKHCFFENILLNAGVDKETADREAHLLEHFISNNSFMLLKARSEKYNKE